MTLAKCCYKSAIIEWMVHRELSCSNSQTKRIYLDVNNTGNHSAPLEKHIMYLIYDFIIVIYILYMFCRSDYSIIFWLFILRTTSQIMVTRVAKTCRRKLYIKTISLVCISWYYYCVFVINWNSNKSHIGHNSCI